MPVEIRVKRANNEAEIIEGTMAIGELALCTSTCSLWSYNGVSKCIVGRAVIDTYSNIATYSGTSGRFFYATDSEQLYVHDGSNWVSAGAGGGITLEQLTTTSGDIVAQIGESSGSAVTKTYTQTSHGFIAGNAIYRKSDSTWDLARADTEITSEAIGIIESVAGNDFVLVEAGEITGLSGGTDGAVMFLSATTSGAITTTEPDPWLYVSKPLGVFTGAATGIVNIMRGVKTSSTTGSGPARFTVGSIDPQTIATPTDRDIWINTN
jgi:hypothetical protein